MCNFHNQHKYGSLGEKSKKKEAEPSREVELRNVVKELPPAEDKEQKLPPLEASGEEDAKPSMSSPMKEEEALTALALSAVDKCLGVDLQKKMFFQVSLPCTTS